MRRRNNKLLKTLMLGSMAFVMMACSYKASATEQLIYKCVDPKGQVAFQDFACNDKQKLELLKLEINQSADTTTGLRENEKVALARLHQRQMLEKALRSPRAIVVYNVTNP